MSEEQFQAELDGARGVRLRGDRPEAGAGESSVWQTEDNLVQQVEGLGSELRGEAL